MIISAEYQHLLEFRWLKTIVVITIIIGHESDDDNKSNKTRGGVN